MRASTAATNADFSSLIVQGADVSRIFGEGMADRSSLSADDMQRFDFLVAIAFTGYNQEY